MQDGATRAPDTQTGPFYGTLRRLLSTTLSQASPRRHSTLLSRIPRVSPPEHNQYDSPYNDQEVHDRHVQIEELPREQPLIEIIERSADGSARRREADPAVQIVEGDLKCFLRGRHGCIL